MRRHRRLGLERLETRDVPASFWYAQNFDTATAGSLPANWAQWASDAVPSFGAANAHVLSVPQSLKSSGTSARTAQTWYNQAAPVDLQVAGSIYADSLIPLRLFLRGSNLNGATPTYY